MSRDTRADCDVSAALVACRNGVVAVAVFSFFQNLLMLSAPLYMLQVYDRVLASRSVDTLIYLTVVLALALAVLGLLDLARGRMLANVAMWLDHRLSPGLFERAVQSRLGGRGYGPEALADLATMRNFVSSSGLTAMFDLPWTAIFVAVTFMLHPYFGYITVAAVALLLFLGLIGEYATRGAIRAAAEAGMVSRRDLDATARNAEAIEAMGMMPHAVRKWAGRNSEALGLQAVILRRTTLLGSASKFVRLIVQSLGLGVGAWLVIEQQTTGGVMIAASILMTRAVAPIEQGIGAWKNVVSARAALTRLRAFSLMPAYRPEAMPLPEPKGDLTAESVGFNIGPLSPPILRGISFSLSAGESMAVIGPSGAGKSTLARLLAGAVPPSRGVVRLDGADIFAWDREQAGRFVGYLPQDVELFSGTVLENISRLRDVDPEEIVSAAMMANVHDLILRLPKGYDTEIGEDGEHLSGGQRQRIALARAVMGNPKLVVLDEPNSNLDGDGEIALVKAMATLKQAGCTLVVITHRMSLMQYVDKMLFLRDGQVEAFGPRQEIYARLVDQKPAAASRPGQVVVPIQQGA